MLGHGDLCIRSGGWLVRHSQGGVRVFGPGMEFTLWKSDCSRKCKTEMASKGLRLDVLTK